MAPIGWCKLHGERWTMRQAEPVIEESGVVEDIHHLRPMVLLEGAFTGDVVLSTEAC